MNKRRILVIDDEDTIQKLLEITLESNGYSVLQAFTAKDGEAMASSYVPDLVMLDIGLPDDSGLSVLKRLREWYPHPILILSVQNSEETIVSALDLGANDYLVKPFRTGELLARLRTSLRNSATDGQGAVIKSDDIEIDLKNQSVKRNGDVLKLTSTEYTLLSLLAKNAGKVLTHQFLLNEVWGPSFVSQSQYLRVFIAQIRKKIEKDPNRPRIIATESGIGYRFMHS
jgi:two-component system KDP operon response regulator KdpE